MFSILTREKNVALMRHIAVIVLYTLFTVMMTYPVILNVSSSVAGTGGDPWQTMWRFEIKSQLLRQSYVDGQMADFLRLEFFGGGEPRLVNLSVWPWLWLHILFGQPTAYNIVWLLTYLLSGYGMYLLVRYLAREEIRKIRIHDNETRLYNLSISDIIPDFGPFLSGFVYMFLPYHVAHAHGHFGAMQIQWLPFIFLTCFSFFRKPSLWKTIAFSFLLAVQAWSEHHYLVWMMIGGIIFLMFSAKQIRKIIHTKGCVRNTIILAFLCIIFIVIPYIPTFKFALQDDTSLNLGKEQLVRFSSDVSSYFIPHSWHTLWGAITDRLFSSHFSGNDVESTQYLGIVVLLMVIFFRRSIPKRMYLLWLTIGIVFFIISLGPYLHIFGAVTRVHLPYDIIDELPVVSAIRAVGRAGVMVGFSVVVLFGYILVTQIKRWQSAAMLSFLIVVDYLFFPFPMQSTVLSDVYEYVKQSPAANLVDIPSATNYVVASKSLYASSFHGKNVLGNIALERAFSEDTLKTLKQIPVVRQMLYLRTTELREGRKEFFNQDLRETFPDVMNWIDVDLIVIHPDSLSPFQLESITSFLEKDIGLSRKDFHDAMLYSTSDSNITSDGLFMARKEGWEHVGFDAKRGSVFGEVYDTASLLVVNTLPSTTDIEMSLTVPQESEGSFSLFLDGDRIADFGNQRNRTLSILTSIPSGEHLMGFLNTGNAKLIIQNPSYTVR